MIRNICFGLQVNYPSFFYDFNEIRFLSTDFREILKLNFMKICLVGTELFKAEGQTDREK
jgi:hypothetical protein